MECEKFLGIFSCIKTIDHNICQYDITDDIRLTWSVPLKIGLIEFIKPSSLSKEIVKKYKGNIDKQIIEGFNSCANYLKNEYFKDNEEMKQKINIQIIMYMNRKLIRR